MHSAFVALTCPTVDSNDMHLNPNTDVWVCQDMYKLKKGSRSLHPNGQLNADQLNGTRFSQVDSLWATESLVETAACSFPSMDAQNLCRPSACPVPKHSWLHDLTLSWVCLFGRHPSNMVVFFWFSSKPPPKTDTIQKTQILISLTSGWIGQT